MAEKLSKDKLQEIQEIVSTINNSLIDKNYNTVNVLNALSMLSVSTASFLNIEKDSYIKDLELMYIEKLNSKSSSHEYN
jgi:uncharacterized protein (UPF0297 family)